jgi:hypothetical protein
LVLLDDLAGEVGSATADRHERHCGRIVEHARAGEGGRAIID